METIILDFGGVYLVWRLITFKSTRTTKQLWKSFHQSHSCVPWAHPKKEACVKTWETYLIGNLTLKKNWKCHTCHTLPKTSSSLPLKNGGKGRRSGFLLGGKIKANDGCPSPNPHFSRLITSWASLRRIPPKWFIINLTENERMSWKKRDHPRRKWKIFQTLETFRGFLLVGRGLLKSHHLFCWKIHPLAWLDGSTFFTQPQTSKGWEVSTKSAWVLQGQHF